jgi:hypothetical protein
VKNDWRRNNIRKSRKDMVELFGRLMGMEEDRWPKRIYNSTSQGDKRRGWPKKWWKEAIPRHE